MSENCDVIVILPIYGRIGAIRKPDSGRIVCKTYIYNKGTLMQIWKSLYLCVHTVISLI